jgi:hypothetical protein
MAVLPEWAQPLPLPSRSEADAMAMPLSRVPSVPGHLFPGSDEEMERWLWRYLRGLAPADLAWLSSPAVLVTRRWACASSTQLNAVWAHRWTWSRVADGHVFAQLDLMGYFRNNHSRLWVDDGTDDIVMPDDTAGMTRMWSLAIARSRGGQSV